MEKKYRKVILLFLASENKPIYKFFVDMQKSYMNSNPNVQFLFAYSDLDRSPDEYEYVYGKRFVTLRETMVMQTLHAMESLVREYDFEFLIRTNLSTFWLLDRLLDRLNSIQDLNCIYGRIGQIPPKFVVGQDMVIPKNLVHDLLRRKEDLLKYCEASVGKAEDRVFSEFFSEILGAKVEEHRNVLVLERIQSSENIMEKILQELDKPKYDHVRLKNEANRDTIDTFIGSQLLNHYYEGVK